MRQTEAQIEKELKSKLKQVLMMHEVLSHFEQLGISVGKAKANAQLAVGGAPLGLAEERAVVEEDADLADLAHDLDAGIVAADDTATRASTARQSSCPQPRCRPCCAINLTRSVAAMQLSRYTCRDCVQSTTKG